MMMGAQNSGLVHHVLGGSRVLGQGVRILVDTGAMHNILNIIFARLVDLME